MSEPTGPGPPVAAPGARPRLRAANGLLAAYFGVALSDLLLGGPFLLGGLLVPGLMWAGEWQRLVMAAILHADGLHLLANALLVLVVAGPVETVYGRGRTLLAYLVAALAAGLASAALLPAEGAATASGGGFGLVGVLMGVVFFNRSLEHLVSPRLALWVGGLVLGEIAIGLTSDYVNSVVHLAGLLAGLILSLVLEPRSEPARRHAVAGVAAAVLAVGMGALLVQSRASVAGTLVDRMWRAEDLGLAGRYGQAIEALEPALARGPQGSGDRLLLPFAQNQLAWYYVEEGRNIQQGIALSEASIERLPASPEFLDTLGYLYALAGRCRDAADAMGRAASLHGGYARRRAEVEAACAEGRRPDPDVEVEPRPAATPPPAERAPSIKA